MSEITKLYENAGIEKCNSTLKDIIPNICLKECEEETYKCKDCEHFEYPSFTAGKQINLILCLSKRGIKFNCHSISSGYLLSKSKRKTSMRAGYKANNFPDLLAQHINYIWQDLTEEERKQIKEILE